MGEPPPPHQRACGQAQRIGAFDRIKMEGGGVLQASLELRPKARGEGQGAPGGILERPLSSTEECIRLGDGGFRVLHCDRGMQGSQLLFPQGTHSLRCLAPRGVPIALYNARDALLRIREGMNSGGAVHLGLCQSADGGCGGGCRLAGHIQV